MPMGSSERRKSLLQNFGPEVSRLGASSTTTTRFSAKVVEPLILSEALRIMGLMGVVVSTFGFAKGLPEAYH